jgi:glycerol uptake facilitator-like aquaporin
MEWNGMEWTGPDRNGPEWNVFRDIIFFIKLLYNNLIKMLNKYLVEFLGSVFFLYVIIATGNAVAIGAALAIAIMLGGHISGGHFNSAVTVMMAAAGKIPMSDVVPYILAQIAGGLVALEIHKRFKF